MADRPSLEVDGPPAVIAAGVTAILLTDPANRIRRLPVRGAEMLSDVAAERPSIVGTYVVGLFLVLPLLVVLLAG